MKRALLALFVLPLSATLLLLGGQTSAPLRAQLVGTWRLASAMQRLADGTVRPDPQTGQKGVGYLIYTGAGRACVVVANPDRPRWKTAQAPTETELRSAFDGLVACAGTLQVNEADRYGVHRIEVDRVPNLLGADRKRFCTLSGNQLVHRAAPPLPPDVQEWAIVWERVEE